MGRELTCSSDYSSRSVVSHASCSSQYDCEISFPFEQSFFTAGLKLKCDEQYKLGNGSNDLSSFFMVVCKGATAAFGKPTLLSQQNDTSISQNIKTPER